MIPQKPLSQRSGRTNIEVKIGCFRNPVSGTYLDATVHTGGKIGVDKSVRWVVRLSVHPFSGRGDYVVQLKPDPVCPFSVIRKLVTAYLIKAGYQAVWCANGGVA